MIVHTMYNGLHVTIPGNAYSLDGFRAWATSENFPQTGRITYLNGEVYVDMSPEKFESHNKVKTEVGRVLGNLVKELDLGNYCADGQWITNDDADLSNEPDGTFVSWSKLESGQVRVVPLRAGEQDGIELRGTPDWVLEVVSDSSLKKDTQVLLDGHHRAGIREYWLVDARGDELDFKIFRFLAEGYEASEGAAGWLPSEVFDREFKLDRHRDRIGGWTYTLHARSGN